MARPRTITAATTLFVAAASLLGAPDVSGNDRTVETSVDAIAFVDPDPGFFRDCGVLLEGQESDCILFLQNFLNMIDPAYNLVEDGSFGPSTRAAVLDFQARNDLDADGNVGPVTAERISDVVPLPEGDPIDPRPTLGYGTDVLAERCPEEFASMQDYLTGAVDPPRCFPYQPEFRAFPWGLRAIDPFRDGCSGPTDDENPLWDRRLICGTHDYGYDLLRYGVDTFREPDVDGFFLEDMLAECDARPDDGTNVCEEHAFLWRLGVRHGNVQPGMPITSE